MRWLCRDRQESGHAETLAVLKFENDSMIKDFKVSEENKLIWLPYREFIRKQ